MLRRSEIPEELDIEKVQGIYAGLLHDIKVRGEAYADENYLRGVALGLVLDGGTYIARSNRMRGFLKRLEIIALNTEK
jgi:hypothetical protein